MATLVLWFHWTVRDLRKRWVSVTLLALIIAVGTGVSAGFTSTTSWTRRSYDASYDELDMYDLRVRLDATSFVDTGALRDAVRSIPNAQMVARTEERLIVPIQVDASRGDETIIVPGELMGLAVGEGEPSVNRLHINRGRALQPADSGQPIGILRTGFALAHDLPAQGSVLLGGAKRLDYVGLGATPDYFAVTARAAGFTSVGDQPNYAVLFSSLQTAQSLSGHAGAVNDLVLTLVHGADRGGVRTAIETALRDRLPGASATVSTTEDNETRRLLYDDVESSRRMIDIMAWLILAGAALAAFNLTSRLVEAQRREIGVGMALGVWPIPLAVRPLLFAAEVAVLGVLAGIPVGILVGEALEPLLQNGNSLPVWDTSFSPPAFARAAAFGFTLPFIAALYPIVRAIRVQPIQAIRTGFLAGKSGGLAPLARHLPVSRSSLGQMPVRNVLRTPRRTLMTALALGGAIIVLSGSLGLIDTFNGLVGRAEADSTRGASDRMEVQLDTFYPRDAEVVRTISDTSIAMRTETGLRIDGAAIAGGRQVNLSIDLLDFGSATWSPELKDEVDSHGKPGIALSEKAMRDLHVQPGDIILLRHPLREGTGFRLVETPVVVFAVHTGAFRYDAYMDASQAGLFGLDGATNLIQLRPAPGMSSAQVQRSLFGVSGIILARPGRARADQLRDNLGAFFAILLICVIAALALVLLVALNATGIATDERAREHATMFAFGLPVPSVLGINIAEAALIGLVGALIGVPAGFLMMRQVVDGTLSPTYPELSLSATFSLATVVAGTGASILTMAIGPLFTHRRLQRMNLPSTLRVVE